MPKLDDAWRREVVSRDLSEIELDALAEQVEMDKSLAPATTATKLARRRFEIKHCEKVDMVLDPQNGDVQIMRYYKSGNHDLYRITQAELSLINSEEAKIVLAMLMDPATNSPLQL